MPKIPRLYSHTTKMRNGNFIKIAHTPPTTDQVLISPPDSAFEICMNTLKYLRFVAYHTIRTICPGSKVPSFLHLLLVLSVSLFLSLPFPPYVCVSLELATKTLSVPQTVETHLQAINPVPLSMSLKLPSFDIRPRDWQWWEVCCLYGLGIMKNGESWRKWTDMTKRESTKFTLL